MRTSRRTVLAAVAVSSLTLAAMPAFAGTAGKPKVVVFKAGVKSLPKSVALGKSVTVDPRATTLPKSDGVTAFTLSYGDGTTVKHKGGLTPLKHTYKKAGTYKLTLTVTDKHKKTVRTTVKLVVAAPKPVATPTPTTAPTVAPVAPKPTPTTPPAPVVTPDPTGPLAGTIKHNGVGVAGLSVIAVSAQQSGGSTALPEYRTTTTADGAFALQTPAGSSYLVYVDMDPEKLAPATNPAYSAEAFSATVPAGGSTTLNASVDAAVTVTGVVQDSHADAAPSAVVLDQFIGYADLEVSVLTSSTGAYTVTGASDTNNAAVSDEGGISSDLSFAPNSLYLQYGTTSPDLTKSGGATAAQGIEALADGSAVSGTLDTPAAVATPAGNLNVTVLDSGGDDVGEATTATDGTFTVGHLPADTYSVIADNPDAYSGEYNAAYAYNTPYSVTTTTTPAATKPVSAGTLALRTPGTIGGTVSDAKGAAPGASVTVTTDDNVTFFTTADASGKYTLPGLPASTSSYTVDASYDGPTAFETGSTTATVTAGKTTTADITVMAEPATT